jgi:hypothetical protein
MISSFLDPGRAPDTADAFEAEAGALVKQQMGFLGCRRSPSFQEGELLGFLKSEN